MCVSSDERQWWIVTVACTSPFKWTPIQSLYRSRVLSIKLPPFQQYPCWTAQCFFLAYWFFFYFFFSAPFFWCSDVLPLLNKGCWLVRVHRHQDWLKTLMVGGWQDGWAGFQSWNLSDPAAVQVNYVGIQLELREAFCRRCTFYIHKIFSTWTHWNLCTLVSGKIKNVAMKVFIGN